MPVTLQFGPWSPDQADTPIQIPDSQGPLMVPCADVLNVIYVNGNYRSIASPSVASINGNAIQALSVPPVNAFSYFDEVAQQATVFAGTATGVQQLNPDGSWSNVALTTNQLVALFGQSLSIKAGNFLNTSLLRSTSVAFTTGSLVATVSATSFIAGTFTINSGNMFNGQPNVVFTYTGYKTQGVPTFGSLVKDQIGLISAYDVVESNAPTLTQLQLSASADPGKSFFIKANANGVSLASSAASYTYSSGVASWSWSGSPFGFSPGSTYNVTLS